MTFDEFMRQLIDREPSFREPKTIIELEAYALTLLLRRAYDAGKDEERRRNLCQSK